VLGQLVNPGERSERRVTAAEAFLLELARKGPQGAALLPEVRSPRKRSLVPRRHFNAPKIMTIMCKMVGPGSVGCPLDALAMAVKRGRYTEAATALKAWVVELALARLRSGSSADCIVAVSLSFKGSGRSF
jgi:hypothetical protein